MNFDECWQAIQSDAEGADTMPLATVARKVWDASREAALEDVDCENSRYHGYFCGTKDDNS